MLHEPLVFVPDDKPGLVAAPVTLLRKRTDGEDRLCGKVDEAYLVHMLDIGKVDFSGGPVHVHRYARCRAVGRGGHRAMEGNVYMCDVRCRSLDKLAQGVRLALHETSRICRPEAGINGRALVTRTSLLK